MKPHGWLNAAALSLSLLSLQALAGSAVVERPGGDASERMLFEYQGGNLRVQASQDIDGYLLYREGKAYVVAGGMVMDAESITGMFGGKAQSLPGLGDASSKLAKVRSLTDTGRKQTLAGIEGRVHVLRYEDDKGKEHSEEIVLSRDARAREFFEALDGFLSGMLKESAGGDVELRRRIRGQGVLRFGDDLQVASFGPDPAPERFELPQASQQMPNLSQLFQPQQLEQLKALVEQGLPPEQQKQLEEAMKKMLGGAK